MGPTFFKCFLSIRTTRVVVVVACCVTHACSAVTTRCWCEASVKRSASGSDCSSSSIRRPSETRYRPSGNERIHTTAFPRSGSAVCRPALTCRRSGRGSWWKERTTATCRGRCMHSLLGRTRRTISIHDRNNSVEPKRRPGVGPSLTRLAGSRACTAQITRRPTSLCYTLSNYTCAIPPAVS